MKTAPSEPAPAAPKSGRLLQSDLIFSAVSFATGLGNLAFQGVMARHLKEQGQYGNANSALNAMIPLLGLLPSIASLAVTHYIAHFTSCGDHARLQGLLAGCRKFLIRLTLAGSAVAVVAIKPLSHFFGYHETLMLTTLACSLISLWASLGCALCQGFAWFKRLAFIGFLSMLARLCFGWFVTLKWPSPETAVLATAFSMLAYALLFLWKRDLKANPGQAISPWNHEFVYYLVTSAACVCGGYFFLQGDLLVAKKFLTNSQNDAYNCAERLAAALPMTVSPLLIVLFTSRSGARAGNIVGEQLKLLGLYVSGLLCGAGLLYVLRGLCVRIILGRSSPEAEAMIGQLALVMVFAGLLQSLALWSLASRWSKICLLYGALGIVYWLTLLAFGKSPAALLHTMLVSAGLACGVVVIFWLITMHRHRHSVRG